MGNSRSKRKVLSLVIVVLVILLVLFLGHTLWFRSLDADGKLNVVLITLDTTRPDRLGCYGYKGANTPNIDEVARQGAVFTQAIAPIPITLSSHSSMLTGLDVFSHGIRENGTYYLKENFRTLAEILKEKGYAVVTKLIPAEKFWEAEDYHQDYYIKKNQQPYCHVYKKKF